MILFACDLDNTLIQSYKYRQADDICIEHYEGREQTFIAPQALDLLKKIAAKVTFIPITTRSIAQYQRIFWTEDFSPKLAVVSNGAYFLNGDKQEKFLREVATPYESELKCQLALADKNIFTIARIVDESFLFLRCRDDIEADEILFKTNLTVEHTGKKIYLFPPLLNKGEALKLLIKKLSPDKVICAGDSEIDLPMLELADLAFIKKNPHDEISRKDFAGFSTAEEFLKIISSSLP